MDEDIVIVGASRTPVGSFLGALSTVPAPRLGAVAIKGALAHAGVAAEAVDQVIMGCVLQAGIGQAAARQALLYAGLPDTVPAVTLHKVCGSGMRTVTAANASKINDGAAALVLTTAERARKDGLKPLARIVAQAGVAQQPEWFTTAPIGAIKKALKRAGLGLDDIDLFEINEAFAVVALAAMRELGIPHDKLDVHGGAVALGHPIGASGARILVTLVHALRRRGLRRGCAGICIGGGEATAMVVESLS